MVLLNSHMLIVQIKVLIGFNVLVLCITSSDCYF